MWNKFEIATWNITGRGEGAAPEGTGGDPRGFQHHLDPKMGGKRGEHRRALSQPVDPGGVGGSKTS